MAAQMKKFHVNDTDATVRRLHKKITELGLAALPEKDLKEYNMIVADMTSVYSVAKICLDEAIVAAGQICPNSSLVSLDPSKTTVNG
jgi:hypothetical protein